MPKLRVPAAQESLKPIVGQFIVTTHDCQIVVSEAVNFTRNRGLGFMAIVVVSGRYVQGLKDERAPWFGSSPKPPAWGYIRQRADVLAHAPTFGEAVALAYTFFATDPEEQETHAAEVALI